jgi:hypothetical protein
MRRILQDSSKVEEENNSKEIFEQLGKFEEL